METMGLKDMRLFDYIFYRVYKFYQKRDTTTAIYASGVLSVIQFFLLLSILAIVRLFVDFEIPHRFFVIPIILVILGLNWYKYEKKLDFKKFEIIWSNEQQLKRVRRGWFIVVVLSIVILFPIVIGILK